MLSKKASLLVTSFAFCVMIISPAQAANCTGTIGRQLKCLNGKIAELTKALADQKTASDVKIDGVAAKIPSLEGITIKSASQQGAGDCQEWFSSGAGGVSNVGCDPARRPNQRWTITK